MTDESIDQRVPFPLPGPTAWAALAALVVGVTVLGYGTVPEQMTIHWRLGLDGTVSERTAARSAVLLPSALLAVLTFAVAAAFARVRDRSSETALVYDLVVTSVLVVLLALQVALVLLNVSLA
ncbi:hypothetical protein OB905_00350 [Halobacteria archaeon AArc-dxtr1]|nr:hypothetical protein [Halobacteria archaeon AArc-dxtr1]